MRISKRYILLALSFVLLNTSCKKILKEFAELFSKESVEKLSKEAVEEGVEVSAKSLGRGSVKVLPYDEFFESLAKENKSLVRSLKSLDDGLQKSIANAMQTDEAFARMMQSSKTLGDEFIIFTKEATHLKKDFSVFRLFLASKNAVQGSPWHRLGIRSNGVGTELLQGDKVLGELRDGVLTLRETIIPNKGFAPNSLLSDELLPNTLFKIPAKAGDARSLIIKTDALGRMEMSNLSNASFDELVNTSLMRQKESFLSAESLAQLRKSLGDKLYGYRINYDYLGEAQMPSFIKLEVFERGKLVLRKTLEGIKALSPEDNLGKAYLAMEKVYSKTGYLKGFNREDLIADFSGNKLFVRHRVHSATAAEFDGKIIRLNSGSNIKSGEQNQFLNSIIPNRTYIVDELFEYQTDDLSRVVTVKGNITKAMNTLIDKGGRDSKIQSNVVKTMDGLFGDDGGHIIARSMKGPNEMINQVPMEASFNRNGQWRELERQIQDALTAGKQVIVESKLLYNANSRRPHAIELFSKIDGEETKIKLSNPVLE